MSVREDDQCPDPAKPGSWRKTRRADLLLVQGFPFMEFDERDPMRVLDQTLNASMYGVPPPPGWWSEGGFRNRLERAKSLQGAARVAAYRKLVDELTRGGPLAVFGSWIWPEYFSPTIGCKVFQTLYGVADLGALCKHG